MELQLLLLSNVFHSPGASISSPYPQIKSDPQLAGNCTSVPFTPSTSPHPRNCAQSHHNSEPSTQYPHTSPDQAIYQQHRITNTNVTSLPVPRTTTLNTFTHSSATVPQVENLSCDSELLSVAKASSVPSYASSTSSSPTDISCKSLYSSSSTNSGAINRDNGGSQKLTFFRK